uniref:Uncharacterized protein n=1 Tax=Aegilops tauschii subsp. strangulata TaxID=200361 RepID=A0A453JD67_AEGTS
MIFFLMGDRDSRLPRNHEIPDKFQAKFKSNFEFKIMYHLYTLLLN